MLILTYVVFTFLIVPVPGLGYIPDDEMEKFV